MFWVSLHKVTYSIKNATLSLFEIKQFSLLKFWPFSDYFSSLIVYYNGKITVKTNPRSSSYKWWVTTRVWKVIWVSWWHINTHFRCNLSKTKYFFKYFFWLIADDFIYKYLCINIYIEIDNVCVQVYIIYNDGL